MKTNQSPFNRNIFDIFVGVRDNLVSTKRFTWTFCHNTYLFFPKTICWIKEVNDNLIRYFVNKSQIKIRKKQKMINLKLKVHILKLISLYFIIYFIKTFEVYWSKNYLLFSYRFSNFIELFWHFIWYNVMVMVLYYNKSKIILNYVMIYIWFLFYIAKLINCVVWMRLRYIFKQ